MKAHLRSTRIAPKKANLIAKMIRGLPVNDALHSLERTNKKAARILETLLRSAMANAQNNENQDPNELIVKTLIVNQGQAYHRGVPMARGRVRPMRKFLSHITLTLGIASEKNQESKSQNSSKSQKSTFDKTQVKKAESKEKSKKDEKEPSQKVEKKVKKTSSKENSSDLEKGSSSKEKKTASDPKVSADSNSSTSK
ncbi:50S ribosomal protein L22 [Patescibacteria group bacterium]|nr:50S ribosomal protein L22 [Patescibacteria group bacterium]MBU1123460.1 50S ribosomal protein L22 [Patescibacteria group bacterium]MBU1911834.1 50S ribosomal protein L22 [Patescibacteria group bacterium]